MLAGVPAAGGELQGRIPASPQYPPYPPYPPTLPAAPPDPRIVRVGTCDALAEGVRLGPSRQGASGPVTLRSGASVPTNAGASPVIGRRLRLVHFAPPPSMLPFAVILRNGREWKKRGAKCTRLRLSFCAALYRPRVCLSALGFGLGLTGTCVYGQMGAWGVMFLRS